jgi:plastocyanin
MTRRTVLRVALGCCAIAASACANGAPSSPSGSSGPAVGTGGINLGTPTVHIAATDQLQFSLATQAVHVGDVVQWTNTGTVPHTVTFDGQPYLTDPTLAPEATWEVKFTVAGTYSYQCTIHPGMDGTLVVK